MSNKTEESLSRRSFLKIAATLASVGVLGWRMSPKEAQTEQVRVKRVDKKSAIVEYSDGTVVSLDLDECPFIPYFVDTWVSGCGY